METTQDRWQAAFEEMFEAEMKEKQRDQEAYENRSHFHNTYGSGSDGWFRPESGGNWQFYGRDGQSYSYDRMHDNGNGTFTAADNRFFGGRKNSRTFDWGDITNFASRSQGRRRNNPQSWEEVREREREGRRNQAHYANTRRQSDKEGYHCREPQGFFDGRTGWRFTDPAGNEISFDRIKDNDDGTFTCADDGFFTSLKNKRTYSWSDVKNFR